jgi:dTMP kinase
MQGQLIVLEGPDGAGTTTHAGLLSGRLLSGGREVVLTKEPTDGQHGRRLRRCLAGQETLTPQEFQRAFTDDRAEHVALVILPALQRGAIVVTDRYALSTIVYGQAQGVDRTLLVRWNEDFPKPDIVIATFPSFAVCRERLSSRESTDAFEQEDFNRRVYDVYAAEFVRDPSIRIVDTGKGKKEAAEEIWGIVGNILER